MKIMNKIGAETTITVYWFAILVIVAGAVVYMVSLVYGQPYDVREAESEILANNIADCISDAGYLTKKSLEPSFAENFLEICKINLDTGDFPDSRGEYYIEVGFYKFDEGDKVNSDISEGNVNLKQYCGIEGKTNPVCSNRSFYAIDEAQNSYRINIISVVNKADKNI